MIAIRTLFPVALYVVIPSLAANAQSPCNQWFEGEWARAQSNTFPVNINIVVSCEQHWHPPIEAMRQMAQRIESHPEHPERLLYQVYNQRSNGGPTSTLRSMWFGRSGAWRLNEDRLSAEFPKGSFLDTAATPKLAFFLQNDGLSILDPRDGIPPGKDPSASFGVAQRTAQIVLTSGVWLAAQDKSSAKFVQTSDSAWHADCEVPQPNRRAGTKWRIDGTWSETDQRGLITRVTFVASPVGEDLFTVTSSRQGYSDVLNAVIAKHVEIRSPADELVERFEVRELAPATDDDIFTVTTQPRFENGKYIDAVRDVVNVRVMHDHVSGKSAVRTANDTITNIPLPEDSLSAVSGSSSQLTVLGFISAGGLFVSLVLLKIWRRAKSQP